MGMSDISSSHKQRYSNIELLRIFSIIAIISYHIVFHNNWWFVEGTGDWGNIFVPKEFTIGVLTLQSFLPLGVTAVNIFVLITGFFLINSTKIKVEKCLKIYIQMFFYSVLIALIFLLFHDEILTLESIIVIVTPITHNRWWFLSTYLLLLILSPFINIIISKVNEVKMASLLVFFIIIWFTIPMITNYSYQGNELWWFVIVYTIGGIIRKRSDCYKKRSSVYFLYAIIVYSITVGMIVLFDFYNPTLFEFNHIQTIQYRNSIFTLLIAIFIFLGFKNIEIKENRVINYIASLTLGVYIIHEHYLVVEHIFKLEWVNSCSTVLEILTTIIILTLAEYSICLMIETVRKTIFDNYILKKITNSIDIQVVDNSNNLDLH